MKIADLGRSAQRWIFGKNDRVNLFVVTVHFQLKYSIEFILSAIRTLESFDFKKY